MPSGIYIRTKSIKRIPQEIKICPICNKKFETRITSKQKFCSNKCRFESMINKKQLQETCKKKSESHIGLKQSEKTKQLKSNSMKKRWQDSNSKLNSEEANKGRKKLKGKQSEETKLKKSKSMKLKGNTYEEIHGLKRAKEIKLKKRISFIKSIEQNYGICYPTYNKQACEFFKSFDEQNNTKGRFAVYGGGEYKIENLGYFLDYFNSDLKIIIEVDEKYHEKQIEKDLQRQKEIQEFYPDFQFLRFKEEEMDKILEIKLK